MYNWKNTQTSKLISFPTLHQTKVKKDFDTMTEEELRKKYKKGYNHFVKVFIRDYGEMNNQYKWVVGS